MFVLTNANNVPKGIGCKNFMSSMLVHDGKDCQELPNSTKFGRCQTISCQFLWRNKHFVLIL